MRKGTRPVPYQRLVDSNRLSLIVWRENSGAVKITHLQSLKVPLHLDVTLPFRRSISTPELDTSDTGYRESHVLPGSRRTQTTDVRPP